MIEIDTIFIVPICILDKPTARGRIYTTESFTKALDDYHKEFVLTGKAFGQVISKDRPRVQPELDLADVSHQITDTKIKSGVAYANIKILSTPRGNILYDLLSASNMVNFRPTGTATYKEDGHTIENFQIYSIDCIPKP